MKYELSEKKTAALLGVSVGRISQLVGAKQLDAVTINGKVRISRQSVEGYRAGEKKPGRPSGASYATAARYALMNADYEVARVVYDTALDDPLSVERVIDAQHAPLGVLTSGGKPKKRELNEWWRHRSIPNSRPGFESKLVGLGIDVSSNLAVKNLGLSLSDCYWLCPVDNGGLSWRDINYFENDFAESAMTGWDSWLSGVGLSSPDNTSEGELPKKWVIDGSGARLLLKGGGVDDQRPYNEVVATALHRRLLDEADYVAYDMVSTVDGPACCCGNFLNGREEYIPAAYVKDLGGRIRASSVYDRFCRTAASLGVDELELRTTMSKMIICDLIVANFDRHWRNFGFIRDIDTLELRAAPIFDSGNCLWFNKTDREVAADDRAFLPRPFAHNAVDALACVDNLDWFDPAALDGFADEACELLQASKHASKPGRIDFIHEGLEQNIEIVRNAAKLLTSRIARGV